MNHELNAEVEERIMGFKWDDSKCRVCGWKLDPDVIFCRPDNCSLRPPPERRADEAPDYSGDIALAWKVVEKARLLIPGEDSRFECLWFEDGLWTIGSSESLGCLHAEVCAPTVPLVICCAALAALEP